MDVLELPRPVINFLRTMAKESCRYALSWDIFGGPDSVTLTLTWKLIDDDLSCTLTNNEGSTHQLKHGASNTTVDDNVTRSRSSTKTTNQCSSSPRRSRRDENITNSSENTPVPAIFRSSRGKSLEGNSNKSSNIQQQQQPHQLLKEHQTILNNLERTTPTNHSQVINRQQRKDTSKPISPPPSDQIYGHLYETRSASVVKCATISSLSSSSPSPQPNTHSSSTNAVTQSQRIKSTLPINTPPHARKPQRSLINSSRSPTTKHHSTSYTKSRRNHHMARHDEDENDYADDDDDSVDPWVKRFETSLEMNEHLEMSESTDIKDSCAAGSITNETNLDETGLTSGKVKFKSKPDYF